MFDIAFMSENDYAVVQILWVQVPLEKSSPQSEGTVCTLVLSSAYLVNAVRTPQRVRPWAVSLSLEFKWMTRLS